MDKSFVEKFVNERISKGEDKVSISFFEMRIKNNLSEKDTEGLKHITAGDFPIVKKKLDILEDGKYTKENILKQLFEEQKEKEIADVHKVGF